MVNVGSKIPDVLKIFDIFDRSLSNIGIFWLTLSENEWVLKYLPVSLSQERTKKLKYLIFIQTPLYQIFSSFWFFASVWKNSCWNHFNENLGQKYSLKAKTVQNLRYYYEKFQNYCWGFSKWSTAKIISTIEIQKFSFPFSNFFLNY